MTDKEFIEYLAKAWINSGADYCSKCVYSAQTELCEFWENYKNNGVELDDDSICIAGLRAYAEITRSCRDTEV